MFPSLTRPLAAAGLAAALFLCAPAVSAAEEAPPGGDAAPPEVVEHIRQLLGGMGGPRGMEAIPVKRVKAAYLGVVAEPADAALRAQVKLPEGVGLVVRKVAEDSPAAAAGIRVHDILHKLGDQLLVNEQQFIVLVRLQKPGDEVALTVIREGETRKISAKLAEKEMPELRSYLTPGLPGGAGAMPFMMPGGNEWRFEFPEPGEGPEKPDGGAGPDARKLNAFLPALRAMQMGDIRMLDGEHEITITTRDGRTQILAKDKDGKVVYQGDLAPGAKLEGIPRELRLKIEALPRIMMPLPPPAARDRPGIDDQRNRDVF
ncbi:MAG TPA: PDZ domain-containing protein [Planctomycetota bacterium]|nr:PDZ domain-containing protein [Planctomycetota bacterium]